MTDEAMLDRAVVFAAQIDARDGFTGTPGQTVRDVLHRWESRQDALERMAPFIKIHYHRFMQQERDAGKARQPLPPRLLQSSRPRLFRHFRTPS